MVDVKELDTGEKPTWCPGCGNYILLSTLKSVISELGLHQENVVVVSGIGCGSKMPHFIKTYGFEGLHGRILPVASGVKLANKNLTVIAVGGDGDGYGIGGNHFIHAARRNIDITYIVQNNSVYGLTKGQYSPTSQKGFISPTTPFGALDEPVNPIALAISSGATYVARAWCMDVNHLKELIKNGIKHKGFALIDVLQPCLTFNKVNTIEWYMDKIYKLEETGYKPGDKLIALEKSQEFYPKIPVGLFYKEEGKPTYEDQLPQTEGKQPAEQRIENIDINLFLKSLK
jgi:2-oxoglutarate ferredoxin oxidoreductase subunit beta